MNRRVFLQNLLACSTIAFSPSCTSMQPTSYRNYTSSVSDIHGKLDKLLHTMRVLGFPVDNEFNPGLLREEISAKTKHLPFVVPEELYQLYTWRNGTRSDTDLFMFRDHFFISLEQALEEYENVVKYYEVYNALPFASFEGSCLVLPSAAYRIDIEQWSGLPKNVRLERPVISVFQSINVFAYSFSILLDLATDWFEQGVMEKNDEPFDRTKYIYRMDLEHRLWEKHNPGIWGTPEVVYTPAKDFQSIVTISASTTLAQVNQPVVLSATRSTGPIVQAKLASLPIGTCWWPTPPPTYEAEVAANLSWEVEPTDIARFDVSRYDLKREAVFSKPGIYKIRGYSAVWCPVGTWSNTIEIKVLP